MLKFKSAEEISESLQLLQKSTRPDALGETDDKLVSVPKWFQVSDAIVRVRHFDTTYRDGALFYELLDLGFAQAMLAEQGVFVRGGLVIGKATTGTADQQMAFGPAVAEAYELESTSAIYPRIAICPQVLSQYKMNDALKAEQNSSDFDERYVFSMVRSSLTGPWLDYLAVARDNLEPEQHIVFCRTHAENIAACMEKFGNQRRVMEKYLWLASYHNQHIATTFDNDAHNDLVVDISVSAPNGWLLPQTL